MIVWDHIFALKKSFMVLRHLERFVRSQQLKKVEFWIFVLLDNRIPKVLLWKTLKLVCFSSDSDDFETSSRIFTHFPTTTSGVGWLLETITLLWKKFHGPTVSRMLSTVAKVKSYSFLEIRTLRLAEFWLRQGIEICKNTCFSDKSWGWESSRKFSSGPMIMFWVFKTFC